MRRSNRVLLVATAALAAVASLGTAGAKQAPSVGSQMRGRMSAAARAAGVDPARVLRAPASMTVWYPDGSQKEFRTTLGDVLGQLTTRATVTSGPLGTPEVLAGNTSTVFVDYYIGPTAQATCGGVTVTTSAQSQAAGAAVQSATGVDPLMFVPVTGVPLFLTPVPGALSPVIPASSWLLPAYLAGGPVRHVKGSYQTGLHQVGTLIGSGASTATGAPGGAPAWLPMVHSASFLSDSSVDFVGQALVVQAKTRFDLLGQTVCAAVGSILLSDGVAIFDNHPVLGVSAGLPDIP